MLALVCLKEAKFNMQKSMLHIWANKQAAGILIANDKANAVDKTVSAACFDLQKDLRFVFTPRDSGRYS